MPKIQIGPNRNICPSENADYQYQANAGVFVGDNQVDKTLFTGIELNKRESVTFSAHDPQSCRGLISLRDIWIDVDTSSDEAVACYLTEV